MKPSKCITLGEQCLGVSFEKAKARIPLNEVNSPTEFKETLGEMKGLRKSLSNRIEVLFRYLNSTTSKTKKEDKYFIQRLVRLVRTQRNIVDAQIKALSIYKPYYRF